MLPDGAAVSVGSRVECTGDYATVHYVGELPGTKGLWLGVEWDESSRGKHDGCHLGIKYFSTRCPSSGSFVRPSKVSLGMPCAAAIKRRYGEIDDKLGGVDKDIMVRLQKMINAPFLEVVGFDKVNKEQSQFDKIRVVCLRGHRVNGAGPAGELQALCPQIRELDVSKSLLSSWVELSEITVQLKHLKMLTASENKLQLPENPVALQEHFQTLKQIIIGLMDYTWPQILQLSVMWPDLEALLVQYNNITHLSPPLNVLSKLVSLDLEGNKLNDWSEINKLGELMCLESLNLTDTGIRDIWFPENSPPRKTKLFPKLQNLNLIRNNISQWTHVSELDKLPSLLRLRFYKNPVLDTESMETGHQVVLACIGSLAMLNGVVVLEQERKGAEYDYLKRHGQQWLALNKDDQQSLQQFKQLHPRFQLLVDKYGAPEEGEMRVQSSKIADNLISVEIFNPDNLGPPRVKRLLPTMVVQKLTGYAQRLFDTGNKVPQLAYISSKNPDVEIPFSSDMKQLNYYSIEDGDRISVRW